MTDQKNTILAIVLSAIVLIAWQYFVGMPQMEKQRQEAQLKAQQQQQTQQIPAAGAATRRSCASPARPCSPAQRLCRKRRPARRRFPARCPPRPGQALTREAVLAASPRIAIDTPKLERLRLAQGRPARRPRADAIPRDGRSEIAADRAAGAVGAARIRSTRSSAGPPARARRVKLPDDNTVWRQQGAGTLGVGRPVTLVFRQRRRA